MPVASIRSDSLGCKGYEACLLCVFDFFRKYKCVCWLYALKRTLWLYGTFVWFSFFKNHSTNTSSRWVFVRSFAVSGYLIYGLVLAACFNECALFGFRKQKPRDVHTYPKHNNFIFHLDLLLFFCARFILLVNYSAMVIHLTYERRVRTKHNKTLI